MKDLLDFFKDDTGMFSAMRLVFILWSIGVLSSWITLSIIKRQLLDIPVGVIYVMGLCVTGKVAQSVSDNFSK